MKSSVQAKYQEFDLDLRLANRILDTLRSIDDPEKKVPHLLTLITRVSSRFAGLVNSETSGDLPASLKETFDRVLDRSMEFALSSSQSVDHRVDTILSGALAYSLVDNRARAIELLDRAFNVTRMTIDSAEHTRALGSVFGTISKLSFLKGSFDVLRRSVDLVSQIDEQYYKAVVFEPLSLALSKYRTHPEGKDTYEELSEFHSQFSKPLCKGWYYLSMAQLHSCFGNQELAINTLEASISLTSYIDKPLERAWFTSRLVEVMYAMLSSKEAEPYLDYISDIISAMDKENDRLRIIKSLIDQA